MLINTRRQGPHATVVLRGLADDTTAMDLSIELCRLVEAGARTIVVDVRGAQNAEPAVAAVTARFQDLVGRLGGSLTVEPQGRTLVSHTATSREIPGRSRRTAAIQGATPWFG
ncbi:MAG: hypothetical protein ACRDV1_00135 [Actinomycetes bacterium]